MHVVPINPVLKAPGPMRLKLKYGKLLSIFAFTSNLRRYNGVETYTVKQVHKLILNTDAAQATHPGAAAEAAGRVSQMLLATSSSSPEHFAC